MYVTAFYVHWCIVVMHLGNCVAMRHWTLEDNIQYGGHFTSHLVDFGLTFKTMRGQKSEG